MTRFFTTLLLLCGYCLLLSGQTKVQLSIPDVISAGGDAVICAPVYADSFPSIAGVQFSVRWDSSQVDFVEVRYGDNPLELSDARTGMPEADNFGVTFTTDDLSGITLDPGTKIMDLCFTAKNASGMSPLTYTGYLLPEFVKENTVVAFDFDTIPGSITYGSDVATNVLPGDTNADGQVDHTDLLNIGLLHGMTGPARPLNSSAFVNIAAPLWPQSFANGLNHANADANGNGEVADDDLQLVDNYFGQLSGVAYTPAPNISSLIPEASALMVTAPQDTFPSGEEVTLTVSLSPGNPNSIGYGLALTLDLDPSQIDLSSVSLDFSNAFLGADLLTIAKENPNEAGRLEIAMSRKDQLNTTTSGGEVFKITFTPLPSNDNGDYPLAFSVIPNAFFLADETPVSITSLPAEFTVEGSVAAVEPAWGKNLTVFPNPYHSGPLQLRGDLPQLTRVSVLNFAGRRLREFPGNLRALDLTDLPAGSYLLQLETATEALNRKIIKR